MFMKQTKQTIAVSQDKPTKENKPKKLLTSKKTLKPGQQLLHD